MGLSSSRRGTRRLTSTSLGAALALVAAATCGCLPTSSLPGTGAAEAEASTPLQPVGCGAADAAAPPPMAPGGYYTNGGTICTADGTPHLFHGVDRPSMEWDSAGENISADDFELMAGWGANVVRIALNQDFWLEGAALHDPLYQGLVQQAVAWAEAARLDVILDLHWSDCGDLTVKSTASQGCGNSQQQRMADVNSLEFWREVATIFKGDGHVLFELYNEPHDLPWDVWLSGGLSGNFTAAGMQQLYDAVRGVGADNLVVVGGNTWAYNLSDVGPDGHYVHGYNVVYATHPYLTSGDSPNGWEFNFGHLETTDFAPVIATEFGDGRTQCTGDYDQQLIQFCDAHHASWTAWAWFPAGCSFPALISDWANATPTVQGAVVQQFLGSYPKSPGGVEPPVSDEAGLDGSADASADGTAESGGSTDDGVGSSADDAPVDEPPPDEAGAEDPDGGEGTDAGDASPP